jgi:hypothetical protein
MSCPCFDFKCCQLRLAARRDGSDVLVQFGTNVVTVDDCLSLASYFLTLLFNEGHSDANAEDAFSYRNVATWLSRKMERSKTSLHGIKTMVFFQNVGRMQWVTYVIFQDLKIIEEFNSLWDLAQAEQF